MTRTHEIKLDGYGAHTTLAEDRPIMLLGTAESYGIEKLHVVSGSSWEGLTITATFNAPDGTSTDMLMNADGSITVPSEATAKSGSGKIVFTGVSDGVQRISCDLEYFVVAHSAINGAQSGGTAPSWFEQAATRFMPPGGTAGQVLTKLTNTDFNTGWQDNQGGAGLAPLVGTTQTITPSQVLAAIREGRDIALQYTDSYYGTTFVFSAFSANEQAEIVVSNLIIPQWDGLTWTLMGIVASGEWNFKSTNTATKDDVGTAVNEALAQAKASGEFDGADGLTPTIGDNGNWYLGETDTGNPSRGDKGDKGDTGAKGEKGDTGATGAAGKSAYQYAVDGGYTGTEAEFAAKLAQEKFANPNALTFTGAVEGSYDGSAPVSVEIPSGGGAGNWVVLREFSGLGDDLSAIEYTGLHAKEITILYYGRLNNADDNASNSTTGAMLDCNIDNKEDISGFGKDYIMNIANFGYIRGSGFKFATLIRVYITGGVISGDLLLISDSAIGTTQSIVPVRRYKLAETIESIKLFTTTTGILFKGDSKLGVWYR